MRCPHCSNENEEGAAVCEYCDTPLTAYGGQLTGLVSASTLAKAAKLAVRPPVIPIMAGLDVFLAIFGPVAAVLGKFSSRPQTNAEGTNYMGAAFGAVGVAFTAMVLVPVALALLVIAWGTITQKSWAWAANIGVLGVLIFLGNFLLPWGTFGLIIRVVAGVALGVLWIKNETREWYGA